MPQPPVIAVEHPKGGVLKTATAIALSEAAAEAGADVLTADTDPQGSAVRWGQLADATGKPLRTTVVGLATVARIAELADRVAREHDHFTITRNGRADVMLISVAEYESMRETLDLLSDDEAVADLRQSQEDFAAGDTFIVDEVRAELDRRRSGAA
jgi:prevent-host-death family protein